MKPVWILLFGIFLVSPPVESKSKKRKRRAAPPTEQVETKEDKLLSKEKRKSISPQDVWLIVILPLNVSTKYVPQIQRYRCRPVSINVSRPKP